MWARERATISSLLMPDSLVAMTSSDPGDREAARVIEH